jgi:hypothetical protein
VRLALVALVVVCTAGVFAAAALVPGSAEIRLLAVSASTVVTVGSIGGLFHPDVEQARRIIRVLVPAAHAALLAGVSLVYFLLAS